MLIYLTKDFRGIHIYPLIDSKESPPKDVARNCTSCGQNMKKIPEVPGPF